MINFIKRMHIEWIILAIYTALNLKLLSPFIFDSNSSGILLGMGLKEGSGQNLIAIFLGLFLNAALIIYVLRRNND